MGFATYVERSLRFKGKKKKKKKIRETGGKREEGKEMGDAFARPLISIFAQRSLITTRGFVNKGRLNKEIQGENTTDKSRTALQTYGI